MNAEAKLADLKEHWGSAYVFWRGIGGTWCARRRDSPGAEPLVAYSDHDLRLLVRADHDRRTVKR